MTPAPGTRRHVALLRGINVGGHRKVPMADLRAMAEGLGLTDVATYVQSGNLVLTGPDEPAATVAATLAAAIAERFGFEVPVVVRSREALEAVLAEDPFDGRAEDPARWHVLFCSSAPDPAALAAIGPEAFAPDEVVLRGEELHLWTPGGIGESKLARVLTERRLGVDVVTARNRRTVAKLVELAAG